MMAPIRVIRVMGSTQGAEDDMAPIRSIRRSIPQKRLCIEVMVNLKKWKYI